jgi:hypothetical protein
MLDRPNTSGWTVESLLAFFGRRGIPNAAYSIYAEQNESYCLVKEGEEWLVYYSEHGVRNHLGWGKNEPQALDLLKVFVLEGCGPQ